MNKRLLFLGLFCLTFTLISCAHFKGRETIKKDTVVKTVDIPDQVEGIDLVEITTESGYKVEVPRHLIPTTIDGVPYWEVVSVEQNETIKASKDGISMIPGVGTLIGGGLSALLAFTTINQRKQKQAEIDARLKQETKVRRRDKLLIAAAVGVELATTDGKIKEAIKASMTKSEQAEFDEITEADRKKVELSRLSERAT